MDETLKKLNAMHEKSGHWRGMYINSIINLERCIDEYLSRYFCSTVENTEPKKDLIELLLSEKVPFEPKRFAFEFILKKKNPEVVRKYPMLLKDIEKAIQTRNVLAHYMLDASENGFSLFDEGKIAFVRFNHKKSAPIVYSQEDFNTTLTTLWKSIRVIGEIVGEPS